MLTTGQAGEDFKLLNKAARASLDHAIEGLDVASRTLELPASPAAEFKPLPHGTIGRVQAGMVAVLYNKTVVSVLETGDLVLGDTEWVGNGVAPLQFGSEGGAEIILWDRNALMAAITADERRFHTTGRPPSPRPNRCWPGSMRCTFGKWWAWVARPRSILKAP